MTPRARLQRAPLLGFFALTVAWSWACWALSPAIKPQLPWLATLLMFAGSFGPSLAAIVVVASTREVAGLRARLSHCLQWRIGWGWWAFALLLPLRCAETDVLLGHFRPGSVQVRVGDAVATGVWLGVVGNSGNTGEPSLHVHAQRPGSAGAPFGSDPLPIQFDGRVPVRGDCIGWP